MYNVVLDLRVLNNYYSSYYIFFPNLTVKCTGTINSSALPLSSVRKHIHKVKSVFCVKSR